MRTQLVLCSGFLIWPVHFCDSLSNLNAKNNIENLDHPSAGGGETGIKQFSGRKLFVYKVCKIETKFVLCSNKSCKEKCLSF